MTVLTDNATFRHCPKRGSSLVELMAAIASAAVVIIGIFCAVNFGNARSTQLALTYGAAANDLEVGIASIGFHVRQGVDQAGRQFVVYSSRSAMVPVADGNSGGCLCVPYPNAADDLLIYAENGALKMAPLAGGTEEILVSAGVSSVNFSAQMTGSPLVRTGAILYTLVTTARNQTCTLSCSEFPRNR